MQVRENENENEYLKVMVVGSLKSGKTTLCKRNVSGAFIPRYNPTIGVGFELYKPHGEDGKKLQLWDLSGQKRFGPLMRFYFKEANHAVLVIDPTLACGMPVENQVKDWLDCLEGNVLEDIINVALVVSKSDMGAVKDNKEEIAQAIQECIDDSNISDKVNIVNKENIIFLSAKTGENCDSWCDVLLGNNGMAILPSVDALETHYKTSGGSAFATQSIFGLFWKNSYPEVVSKLKERAAENNGGASQATLSTFNIT